jgi:hypothetical protein
LSLDWTYDGVGNRLSETLGGTTDTYVYPPTSNRLDSISQGGCAIRSFAYDAIGNIVTGTRGGDVISYINDDRNRPVMVARYGVCWASYAYNGLEQLVIRAATVPASRDRQQQHVHATRRAMGLLRRSTEVDAKSMKARVAQFVLKSIDAATGCYLEQVHLTVDDPNIPTRILGLETMDESTSMELDESELRALAQALNVSMKFMGNAGELHRLGDAATFNPNSHTGRELLLMLSKKKPFAAFSVALADSHLEGIIPESYFDPHVRKGTILKREHIQNASVRMPHPIRKVLYALPGEEWRFNTYIALWDLAAVHGWNAGFEKLEGYLLGYETTIDPFFKDV